MRDAGSLTYTHNRDTWRGGGLQHVTHYPSLWCILDALRYESYTNLRYIGGMLYGFIKSTKYLNLTKIYCFISYHIIMKSIIFLVKQDQMFKSCLHILDRCGILRIPSLSSSCGRLGLIGLRPVKLGLRPVKNGHLRLRPFF